MPEPREVTIALIDEIQKGFNDHDVDAILSHFADDCDWLMASGPDLPEGRRCVGKAEIAEVLRTRYAAIPDMRWEDMRHFLCGQEKALSEWTVRGTPKDGSALERLGCDIWTFKDGWVTRKDTYWKFPA